MTAAPAVHVESFVAGPLGNNVYLVSADGRALVVDVPLQSSQQIVHLLQERGLTLEVIVLTHAHFDHMAEAAQLARDTGAPVTIHTLDAPGVEQPRRPMMFPDLVVEPVQSSRRLEDGDTISLGSASLEVLHTPGHTPGSICLSLAAADVLLSGDTLFAGSYGRVDLPGGDGRALAASLRRLAMLPPATRVLPGHGAATTIGDEAWLRRLPPSMG